MQPLLALLRWEQDIVVLLMDELRLYHGDARDIVDAHPALMREAWTQKQSVRDTATQLIALTIAEKTS